MEKQQAEAIIQAVMAPDLAVQQELRRRKEAEARSLAGRRFVAALMLIGFAVGAAVAYFLGTRFTVGGLWGAIGAGAIGWIVVTWRGHRTTVEDVGGN